MINCVMFFSLWNTFKFYIVNAVKCVLTFWYVCYLSTVQCGCYECVVELVLFYIADGACVLLSGVVFQLLGYRYCNVDGQSHARPDRDMPVATQPLGCDVTQQEREVRSVTGCYATLYKQSVSALGSDVTYTSQLHIMQHCYGNESTVNSNSTLHRALPG
jgi:hypothetical protein